MKFAFLLAFLTTTAPVFAEEAAEPENEIEEALDTEGLTAAMVEKLSADQLAEILQERESAQNGGMLAVLSSLAFFVVVLGSVSGVLLAHVKVSRYKQETKRAAIAAGINPELLYAPPMSKEADLRRGVLLVSGGVALALVLIFVSPDKSYASVGLLPAVLGAGYLISWRLIGRRAVISASDARIGG